MKFSSCFQWTVVIALTTLSLSSCINTKKVAYLQDMSHETQIELEDKFEAVISPSDELDIMITCYDQELAYPFNIRHSMQWELMRDMYYLVDKDGYIEMPILGRVKAGGMTRLQLQDHIQKMLVDGSYLNEPYVLVRFRNYKIFFLGSNGGQAITITNERCTFLEALALAGDMNIFTDRGKIAVLREVDGKMVTRYLDPRSSDVFKDPFFMLQQNDIIITRNRPFRNFQESANQISPILSFITSVVSFTSLIISIILINQNI
jgi:Periplasmic protein involved in polysaccharide export